MSNTTIKINDERVQINILTWNTDYVRHCLDLIRAFQEVIDVIHTLTDKVNAAMVLIGRYYTEEVDGELAAQLVAERLNSDPGEAYEQCITLRTFVNRLVHEALKKLESDRARAENVDAMSNE